MRGNRSVSWLLLASTAIAPVVSCGDDDVASPTGVAGDSATGQVGGAEAGERPNDTGGSSAGHDTAGRVGTDGGATSVSSGGESADAGGESADAGGESADVGAGGAAQPPLPVAERWLAFRLERANGEHPLWLAPLPSAAMPLLVDANVESFEWSGDGKRLIYVSSPSSSAPNAAYVVEVSGQGLAEPRMIHAPLEDAEARVLFGSISPDGETAALELYEDGASSWYVNDLSSSRRARSPVGGGHFGASPAQPGRDFSWSPDGTRFAFLDGDGSHELVLVDLKDGASEPQESATSYEAPKIWRWSHDSSRLVVEAGTPSQRSLLWLGSSESDVTTLTAPGAYTDIARLQFSPNDARVAFTARHSDTPGLFIASLADVCPVVEIQPFAGDLRWLPDSKHLACWGNEGPHVYDAAVDAAGLERLNPPQTVVSCSVSPCVQVTDGAILFSSSNEAQTANQLYEAALDARTPSVRPLTSLASETLLNTIQISPDGSHVLLGTEAEAESRFQVYLLSRGDVPQARWVSDLSGAPANYAADGAAWSRDARFAYYAVYSESDFGGNSAIYAIDVKQAGPPVPLTTERTKGVTLEIAWQP